MSSALGAAFLSNPASEARPAAALRWAQFLSSRLSLLLGLQSQHCPHGTSPSMAKHPRLLHSFQTLILRVQTPKVQLLHLMSSVPVDISQNYQFFCHFSSKCLLLFMSLSFCLLTACLAFLWWYESDAARCPVLTYLHVQAGVNVCLPSQWRGSFLR